MADISLRTYLEEIDGMIDRKSVDEAIAHCRHILSFYPKHVDAYRLLGKALLEVNRHTDAADIFQRVLSAAPDDFVAHLGMSIIREDEANLEAALWHMERAFEVNPSNAPIQDELRRLYGRRDGVNPPRARLTRGALARLYTLGELYLQAEAELEAALGEDTDRVDLSTILAEVYWRSNRYPEAARVCADLLQKLPYSKEGNRILARILQAQGRGDEARPYQKRLEALDPYEAFANGQGASQVNAETVRLPHLDYSPGLRDPNAPDWVASIGMKLDEPSGTSLVEQSPDWLHAPAEPEPAQVSGLTPTTDDIPDWLRDMQPSETGAAAPAPEAPTPSPSETPDWLADLRSGEALPTEAEQEMPDWLKAATGALDAKSAADWMQPEGAAATPAPQAAEPVSPAAELPDWMQALAPAEAMPTAQSPAPTESAPDWMQTAQPAEELPEWMKAMQPAEAAPVAETPASTESAPDWMQTAQPAEELPEWMKTAQAAEDLPEWMKGIQPTEAAPIAETPAPEPAQSAPDWMTAASAAEDVPEWMKAAQAPEDLPEWMKTMPPAEATPVAETPAPVPVAETPAPAPAESMPDWMTATQPTEELPEWMKAAQAAEDLPEWMKAIQPTEASLTAGTPAPMPAEAAPVAETPAPVPVESAPDRMTAAQPAEELPEWMKAAQAAEELPEWMKAIQPAEAAPVAETPAPVPAESAPDWMTAAPAAEDVPGWMKAMQPTEAAPVAETPAPIESVPDRIPGTQPAEELLEWMKPALSQGEALPGTTEEAAAPTEPEASLPWLQSVPAAPDVAPVEPTPVRPPVELPDFLQLASAEAIERANQPVDFESAEEIPEEEAAAAQPADLPDWLKAMAPPAPETTAPSVPMSEADAMQWAESLGLPASPQPAEMVEPAPDVAAGLSEEQAMEPPEWLRRPATTEAEPAAPSAAQPDISTWAQSVEAKPADTVTNWLAGKPVPEWLRRPGEEVSAPPAEWMRSPVEKEEEPAQAREAEAAAPVSADFDTMSADEAMRWLEGLAAQQGARPEELITPAEERTTAPPEWLSAQPTVPLTPREPTMAAPVEPLTPEAAPPAPTEPDLSSMSADEAMRWLEGLAAQQGARPEELITTPEERTATPPGWVTGPAAEPLAEEPVAEAPASFEAPPAPEVVSPQAIEPDFSAMSADEAMRWLESLAAQQGAAPEELITAPEERITTPPDWVMAQPVEPVAETPAPALPIADQERARGPAPVEPGPETPVLHEAPPSPEGVAPPTAEPDFISMSPDEALRWLEGLAARQGAAPEELVTAPDKRTTTPPEWVAAQTPAAVEETPAPAETFAPPDVEEAAPAQAPPEVVPGPTAPPEPVQPEPALPPIERPGQTTRLTRLAERLAASRRAKESEIEARFAADRARQAEARQSVQEKMEKRKIGTGPLASRPGTGSLRPSEPAPAEAGPPPAPQPVQAEAPRPKLKPPTRSASRPRKVRGAKSPFAKEIPDTILARSQQHMLDGDFETAAEGLEYLVASGQMVDDVIERLEDFAPNQPGATSLLRVLGDAYMRNNQLQKALDAYRQALGQI